MTGSSFDCGLLANPRRVESSSSSWPGKMMMCSRVSAIIVEAAEEAKKRTKFTVFAVVVWLASFVTKLQRCVLFSMMVSNTTRSPRYKVHTPPHIRAGERKIILAVDTERKQLCYQRYISRIDNSAYLDLNEQKGPYHRVCFTPLCPTIDLVFSEFGSDHDYIATGRHCPLIKRNRHEILSPCKRSERRTICMEYG